MGKRRLFTGGKRKLASERIVVRGLDTTHLIGGREEFGEEGVKPVFSSRRPVNTERKL